ncbi:hypothetical protein PCK1_001548 [Pneumocystis canis]|nr:hypothetical protein PCK1_001548 [Pneumocystis canis]
MSKIALLEPLFEEILKHPVSKTFEQDNNENIISLLKKAQEIHGFNDFKSFFECGAKQILYKIAEDPKLSQDEKLAKFYPILDASIIGQQNDILDDILPFILIEDLMDIQTVAECGKLFDFLNSRILFLIGNEINGTKGKGLVLLRLCNELLRRLSKMKDSFFCGNVLMFLSNVFPLRERSGLNLRGDFHIENVTIFDNLKNSVNDDLKRQDEIQKNNGILNNKDKKSESYDHERKEKISHEAFYTVFWSVQNFFSDPSLLYNPKGFQEFKSNTSIILDKIKSLEDELKINETKLDSKKSDRKRKTDFLKSQSVQDYFQAFFNPKFLTSYKLLKLELSDSKFRRQILVQYLILLDYLFTLTETEKNKLEKTKTVNRLLQSTYILSQEDENWVTETFSKVNNILESTSPDGQHFSQSIRSILFYEKNWVNWKLQGCNSFEEPSVLQSHTHDIKKKYEVLSEPLKAYKYPLGNLALTRLWEKGGTHTIEDMARLERHMLPDVKSFLESNNQESKNKNEVTDENNLLVSDKNTIKSWKALRILSRSKLHLFNKLEDQTLEAIAQINEFNNSDTEKDVSISDKSSQMIQESPQKSCLNSNNKRIMEQDIKNNLPIEKKSKLN